MSGPVRSKGKGATMTDKQIAIVTGATGAIGQAIARQLAATPGFEVVLAARDPRKAEKAVAEIQAATGNGAVRFELVDVSRKASVEAFAARWTGPLHVLVNNAAATPRRREETPEGIELQFATNVLGYFWMIEAFAAALSAGAPSRVVNVASYWAGGLDLDDLEFRRRPYDNDAAYRQSKQANRMLTAAHAARLRPHNIVVNACHPGDVNSALSNNLGFGGHETPDEGAATPVWLATDPAGLEATGRYFEHGRPRACPFVTDADDVERLYATCAAY